jgi:hypothetical protein
VPTQVVIAAEALTEANDSEALAPMVELAATELGRAGSAKRPGVVVADAGYWSAAQIDRVREGGASGWSSRSSPTSSSTAVRALQTQGTGRGALGMAPPHRHPQPAEAPPPPPRAP